MVRPLVKSKRRVRIHLKNYRVFPTDRAGPCQLGMVDVRHDHIDAADDESGQEGGFFGKFDD